MNHEGPRHPDREFDLIARAENQLDAMAGELHDLDYNGHLLYGILCAAVSVGRQLYNLTPDDTDPIPPDDADPITAGPSGAYVRDFYQWADSHRLVITSDAGPLADVHLSSLRAFFHEGETHKQITPNVFIVHTDAPPPAAAERPANPGRIVGLSPKCDDPTCSVCGDPDGPGAFMCAP